MTPKERVAMQQALEALEALNDEGGLRYTEDQAIIALREALAEQAEQGPTVSNGVCGGCEKKAADGWALYCVECWEKAEQEPVDHIGIKHDAQLVETFLRCPMTGNQLYFASEPIQKKGMNYMRLQDSEGNDWTLIARLDEGWDGK